MLCTEIEEIEIIKAYNNPIKLIEEKDSLNFDLCILDIEMPELNGVEVAKQLKDKLIIFTTAYSDFAADAFDLDAVDYIRKPLQKIRLVKAIEKAVTIFKQKNNSNHKTITFTTNDGKTLLDVENIYYITSSHIDSRDKLLYLNNSESFILKNISFEQLSKILPHNYFCRLNKKDLINIKAVKSYNHKEVTINLKLRGSYLTMNLGDMFKKDFLTKIQ